MVRILVVEDSPTQACELAAILREEGFEVSLASSGEQGFALATAMEPHLVLSDVVMPGISGYELCSRLKEQPATGAIPVILLTTLRSPLDVLAGLECGADNFITKPYEPEYLVARVRRILEAKRVEKESKVKFGIEMHFMGRTFQINSDKEEILSLLVSTVEEVVRTNRYLEKSQLELADANARIEGYARLLNEQLQSVAQTLSAFLAGGSWSQASAYLTQCARKQTGAQCSCLGAVLDGPRLRVFAVDEGPCVEAAHAGAPDALRPRLDHGTHADLGPPGPAILQVLSSRRAVLSNDAQAQFVPAVAWAGGPAFENFLGVPIFSGEAAVGVLFTANRPGGFDDTHRARLEVLAQTAGVLYESALRHEREALLQQQLRQSQKMEAIGALAGGVAHDFNNLLTVIAGNAEFVLESAQPDSQIYRDVEAIRAAASKASALTKRLLLFSRRSQQVELDRVDLNGVVNDMVPMLRRLIGEDIDLHTVLDEAEGAIQGDANGLGQVIMNLVVNARDAMPRGGVLTLETRRVELSQEYAQSHVGCTAGKHLMLAVSDTGHGMDAETRSRIFEPFFTTKEAGKGTGLGLAVVYGIVNQCGGRLEVYSEPGLGAVFKAYFPLLAESAATKEAPRPEPIPLGCETVLVVEDDDSLRTLTVKSLHRYGYTVIEARGAEEALAWATGTQPRIDVLLTDVVMPHTGGPQLAARLAEHRPGVKVIFMSGYSEGMMSRNGTVHAGGHFLSKPFTPESLARKVRQVLDGPNPAPPAADP
ncbi:MAG: response regulator [Candidatus Riflebacteria bacterium]|nr:response regulator [Candidatus Riflebacteria bacterium]